MAYINQLHPIKYGVEKNKQFLEQIYTNEELVEFTRNFDFLDCSVSFSRQQDKDMTLEKFLTLIDEESFILLQLASPNPYEIRYGIRLADKGVDRFIFIDGPYTDPNFEVVSRLYKQSFGKELEDEPVAPGLHEYYQARIENYPDLR